MKEDEKLKYLRQQEYNTRNKYDNQVTMCTS